jgi:hypothetical protein
MAQFSAEVKNVKVVLRNLKDLQPETFKQLRRDMKNEIKPLVGLIKASIPMTAPLSGFARDEGRLGWDRTNPQSITISVPTSLAGRNATNIVMITENSAAVSLVDKAGMRGGGRFPKKKLAANLSAKPAIGPAQRFGWRVLMKNMKLVYATIENIIEKVESATNQKIKMGG